MGDQEQSCDFSYRYKMPALAVKHEGSSKMKRTVLLNLDELSRAVGRPAEHLLTYIGQSVCAASKVEKENRRVYVAGHHELRVLQQHVFDFIQRFVLCKQCRNPETMCYKKGKKRSRIVYLKCKSCGGRSSLESSDQFMNYLAQHSPEEVAHVPESCSIDKAIALIWQAADDQAHAAMKMEKKRRVRCPCPSCGHKTSKAICSKCGTVLCDGSSDTCADQACGLHAKQWMQEHENVAMSVEVLVDFDSTMKSLQLCSFSDQLEAVMDVVTSKVVLECGVPEHTVQLQPVQASEVASPFVEKWALLIRGLVSKTGDEEFGVATMLLAARKIVLEMVSSDTRGRSVSEAILIGIMLSLQEHEACTSEAILSACRSLPTQGAAMQQFIKFLEREEEAENSGDD